MNQEIFKIDHTGKGTVVPQYIAAISAAIGAFIVGLSLGWSSPVHLRLAEYKFEVTDSDFKWIGSLLALGAATQCIPMGYIVNKYGPKQTILFTCFPCLFGWCCCVFAMNIRMLYIGRLIIGMTSATFCVAIPIYIADISQKNVRGKLCSLFQLNITAGILFTYLIGWKLKVKNITFICGMFPVIFGILFYFMPESPEYLISQARFSKAIDSLKWLRGENYDCNREIENIRREGNTSKVDFLGVLYGLLRRECMRAIAIGVLLMFFQQLSGINAIIFYTQKMFEFTVNNRRRRRSAKMKAQDIHDSCELPMLQEVYEKEVAARQQLKVAGVVSREKLEQNIPLSGKSSKKQVNRMLIGKQIR